MRWNVKWMNLKLLPGVTFVMRRPFHWWSWWLAWLFCEIENRFGGPDRFHWIEREDLYANSRELI